MLGKTWVNGESAQSVSTSDRGLMYGQSVFETIAVSDQEPLLIDAHIERLEQGCKKLNIPFDLSSLNKEIKSALLCVQKNAVLRVSITMGEGGRGYMNPSTPQANRIVALSDYPDFPKSNRIKGIELGVADIRLSHQPVLAGLKHSNRLEQIIARSQWQDNWQEALLLDTDDQVIEATQSNVFIVQSGELKTPDLSKAGVAGVMRNFVLSKAKQIGANCRIMPLSLTDFENADEVFVTNSLIGLWPVRSLQNIRFNDFNVSTKLLRVMQDYGAIPNI